MELLMKLYIFSKIFCCLMISAQLQDLDDSSGDGVADCSDGSIRLYNVYTDIEGEGAVQICYNDTWYSVCDYSWGCADANVACRELGYSRAQRTVYYSSIYFGYWPDIRSYSYSCTGSETSLDSCRGRDLEYYNYYYYNLCRPGRDSAGVRCIVQLQDDFEACSPNGTVRLVNGTETEGIVEYCYNGKWMVICSSVQDEEVAVICRQLGYTPYGVPVYSTYFYDGYSDIRYVWCSSRGTETGLGNCTISTSLSSCASSCTRPAAIRCYTGSSNCSNGAVRLVDGAITQEGRVEVCVDGVWGTVCSTGWSATSAYVVCKQLGYIHSVPDISRRFLYGTSDLPVLYSSVSCLGWESSLDQCTTQNHLYRNCYSRYTAGVLCTDDCVENSLRLVGPTDIDEKTVEVCINGIWGFIADSGWNNADADVVCRQLGLPNGGAIAVSNAIKTERVTVHYSYVLCEGHENLLADCHTVSLSLSEGNAVLDEASIAGVICSDGTEIPRYHECLPKEAPTGPRECSSGDVRIMDDEQTLQYCYNGHWTGLCTMTHREAMVACKQLGYTDYTWGLVYNQDSRYNSESTNRYSSLLKNVSCTGGEASLKECIVHEGECLTQCTESIGLKCFNPTGCGEGAVRLNGGSIEQEGRVEVCVNGVWGSICDYGWDKTDAHVLCKQLGYAELEPIAYKGSTFDNAEGPLIYSHVSCEGWEDDVRNCKKLQYENFTCPHYTVAGVMCSNGCTAGDVRLVNSQSNQENEGTVEICYRDLWGLISDSDWDASDAEVVCRQLGYSDTSGSMAYIGSYYGKPNKTLHAGNVRCQGDENNLQQCSMTQYSLEEGKELQFTSEVAGVSCLGTIADANTATDAPLSTSTSNATSTAVIVVLVVIIAVLVGGFVVIIVYCFIQQKKKTVTNVGSVPVTNQVFHHVEKEEEAEIKVQDVECEGRQYKKMK